MLCASSCSPSNGTAWHLRVPKNCPGRGTSGGRFGSRVRTACLTHKKRNQGLSPAWCAQPAVQPARWRSGSCPRSIHEPGEQQVITLITKRTGGSSATTTEQETPAKQTARGCQPNTHRRASNSDASRLRALEGAGRTAAGSCAQLPAPPLPGQEWPSAQPAANGGLGSHAFPRTFRVFHQWPPLSPLSQH